MLTVEEVKKEITNFTGKEMNKYLLEELEYLILLKEELSIHTLRTNMADIIEC